MSESEIGANNNQAELYLFQKFVIQLNRMLINLPLSKVEEVKLQATQEMLAFTRADRAYIFKYDFLNHIAINTHEVCATGIQPQIQNLQHIPLPDIKDWVTQHVNGQQIHIPNVALLPNGCARKTLISQGIKSMLTLPLMDNDECQGFVGFDSIRTTKTYSTDEIELLQMICELFVNINKHVKTRADQEMIRRLFQNTAQAIMITDPDGNIQSVNPAFERITGYTQAEVIGRNPSVLSSGHHDKAFYEDMWQSLINEGVWSGEIWNRHKNGFSYPEFLTINTISTIDNSVSQYLAIFSDISQQKMHVDRLAYLTHHDQLTNLPNRLLLTERIQSAMTKAQTGKNLFALAFIDIDNFKAVNDQFGHSQGDDILRSISSSMKNALPPASTLARLGGDEFVAIIEVENNEQAFVAIERLMKAIATPTFTAIPLQSLTASVGLTFYPQQENPQADQLLRQADQAMYQAKRTGKNQIRVFDHHRDIQLKEHLEKLSRFGRAIRDNELVLYYQPKVNLRSGNVVGVEALIRWQHPEFGLLPPAEFLPLIENSHLATELDDWVLGQTLAQISDWKSDDWCLPVSINLTPKQLEHPEFITNLKSRLADFPNVEPKDIELEILESTGLDDFGKVTNIMQTCHAIGFNFAIDDFGSGYSSLTYLKRLPVQQIKIDQSFVREMLESPVDIAILEGVVCLADALERSVLAEGVETFDHAEILLLLGCELAQGYGIAKPMPPKLLKDWAKNWSPAPSWQQIKPISRDRLPLLVTMIEYRKWLKAFEKFCDGKLNTLPTWKRNKRQFLELIDDVYVGPNFTKQSLDRLKSTYCEAVNLIEPIEHYLSVGDKRRAMILFADMSRHYEEMLTPIRHCLGLDHNFYA